MSTALKPQEVTDWHELLTAVESCQGVHRVTMETLRRLEGRQRVGKHILSSIEEKLKTLGLGHLPRELPNRQQQAVLLYRIGTPASALVQAVQNGLTDSPSSEAYDFLRRLNTLPNPDDVVSKEEITEDLQDATAAIYALLRKVKPDPLDGQAKDGNVYSITSLLEQTNR